MDQRAVLEQILEWARHDDNIRALVLTGSLARGDGSFDALSDLDLELYLTDPTVLLEQDAWFLQFGEVLVVEALENPGWHPTRLVYYADGKIDFMVAARDALVADVSYDRPFQVLIDKDDAGAAFRRCPSEHLDPPAATEFLRCINWFYAAVLMWAKCLRRGEPWAAKMRDWDSKIELLRMLEWDHKARKGWEYDTWFNGMHLRDWMDPDLLARIEGCWSGFSTSDSLRALGESLALFDEVSTRTAAALGIEPFDATRVRQAVDAFLGTDL